MNDVIEAIKREAFARRGDIRRQLFNIRHRMLVAHLYIACSPLSHILTRDV